MGYSAYTHYSHHPVDMDMSPCPHLTAQVPPGQESQSNYQSNAYPIRRSLEMQNPTIVYTDERCTQQHAGYSQYSHGQYQHYSNCQCPVATSSSSYTENLPPSYDESLRDQGSRKGSSSRGNSQGDSYTSSLSDNLSMRAPPFTGRLVKPIAIPATQATLGSPFLRAYAPILSHFEISREEFLKFLDGLNCAAVASPPIQVLGLAGNIVSMVPLQTTQIVGGVVNAAAKLGTAAISKGRVEAHLREANNNIFAPKGLKAEITKLSALAVLAEMPILGPDGKVDKNRPLLRHLEDEQDTLTTSAQHRRVHVLEKWTERLEVLDLPAAEQSSNPISRMHASASERQRRKEEEKLVKDRSKAEKEWTKDTKKLEREYNKKMRELERDESRARSKGDGDKVDRIGDKRDRVQGKFGMKMGKGELGGNKGEEKLLRKIYFLTVTNADD